MSEELDQLAISTIRTLSIDAVQQANSGHPGTPMALAPGVYTNRVMNVDPEDPIWPNRDRFMLKRAALIEDRRSGPGRTALICPVSVLCDHSWDGGITRRAREVRRHSSALRCGRRDFEPSSGLMVRLASGAARSRQRRIGVDQIIDAFSK